MQDGKNEAPQLNKNMILALGILIILTIVYAIFTFFSGGTSLNQYERTATAIEFNATHSAENNGDIYALTATRLIFQATASPGFFQTEAAKQYIAETATADYWRTQGITPTPDDVESTVIAYFESITQTVEAQINEGCQLKLMDAQRLVVDYRAGLNAPQIRDDYLQTDYLICPNDAQGFPEWINDDYLLIIFFPDNASAETVLDGLSLAIEKIPDYSLEPNAISSGIVSLLIQNGNRQTFSYQDAIDALESGLREQDLLDKLGIKAVMP